MDVLEMETKHAPPAADRPRELCGFLTSRKSCRAFLDTPVSLSVVNGILATAVRAPSSVNHQPFKVALLGERSREELFTRYLARYSAGIAPNPDYPFYPDVMATPYKERRKELGAALHTILGKPRDEVMRMNYDFFGAAVRMVVYIDRNLTKSSWIDCGSFIYGILLGAHAHGLGSCAMASIASYPDIARDIIKKDGVDIVCGIAIGHPDENAPVNAFQSAREPLESYVTALP